MPIKDQNAAFLNLLEGMMKLPSPHRKSDQFFFPNWIFIALATTVIVMFSAAYYGCRSLVLISYVSFHLIIVSSFIYLICFLVRWNLNRIRNFHDEILDEFKGDFLIFKKYFDDLLRIEKTLLRYALSRFREKIIYLDRRFSTGLIVFGTFVAAIIVVVPPIAAKVDKENTLLISVIPTFIVFCYMVFFVKIIELRRRPDEIACLLEGAIQLVSPTQKYMEQESKKSGEP